MRKLKKEAEEAHKLMKNKKRIRNIGIIAHADHGKTTLIDAILKGLGIVGNKQDFNPDLKQIEGRNMTIEGGVVSFVYHYKGDKKKQKKDEL